MISTKYSEPLNVHLYNPHLRSYGLKWYSFIV